MTGPIVIASFSNDIENPLSYLSKERRNIERSFTPLADNGKLRFISVESVNTEDIRSYLWRYDPQNATRHNPNLKLTIFHYAGHANGNSLKFKDQEVRGEGLAKVLGNHKNSLKLVFLNGCSTSRQVEDLLKNGVPAVIATSTAVHDGWAAEFAGFFYEKLISESTIKQAFQYATKELFLKHDLKNPSIEGIDISRGMKLNDSSYKQKESFWGLFFNEQNKDILNWSINAESEKVITSSEFQLNDYLLAVYEVLEEEYGNLIGTPPNDQRQKLNLIIELFPKVIGDQIRLLILKEHYTFSIQRLEQIISIYLSLGQVLYFTLTSQLWNQLKENNPKKREKDFSFDLMLTKDKFIEFDYFKAIKEIVKKIESPFFPELINILNENMGGDFQEFISAYQYLESLKEKLINNEIKTLNNNLTLFCEEAEFNLAILLSRLSFLVNYPIISVREIKVDKPRHKSAKFKHFVGFLNGKESSKVVISKTPHIYDQFMDTGSILIMKNIEDVDHRLNLSPFFIDKNAFGKNADHSIQIYTFACWNPFNGEYYYQHSIRKLFKGKEVDFDKDNDFFHTGMEFRVDTRREKINRIAKRTLLISDRPFTSLKEQFNELKMLTQ